jgi:peroxiredoxin
MARTASMMLPLGTPAPLFSLPDPAGGKHVSLEDHVGSAGVLVAFLCNHCPYVRHIRGGIANFARDYQSQGIGVIGINSNDVENYPADSPERMIQEAREAGYPFPYLYDESQEVAKSYRAACTPDFFLFDAYRRLVYRGQFDGSRPGNGIPVSGEDLRTAADALLAGGAISDDQRASIGCNIKWKSGNEPEYAG